MGDRQVTGSVTVLSPPGDYNCAGQSPEGEQMSTTKPLIVVAVALVGAGCGSGGPPASTGQASNNPRAAAYRYADCIRSHGVSDFPDPRVHINGTQVSVIQGVPPSAAASPRFKSAERACQGIIPAPRNTTSDQPGHRAALLAFARCMRDHGVSGFPDPNPQGQITPGMLSAAGVDLRARQFVRAALGCVSVTHGLITAADVQAATSGAH